MKKEKNQQKKYLGFSIIEIMAVVFIVTIGMVGMMTLIYQSIKIQRFNRHTLIAYQLAQEGIELVRVVRDSNWIPAPEEDFDDLLPYGSYCLDYENVLLTAVAEPCPLYINNDFYSHNSIGELSLYKRQIIISPIADINNNQGVRVVSEISWEDAGGSEFSYQAETKLYNWR